MRIHRFGVNINKSRVMTHINLFCEYFIIMSTITKQLFCDDVVDISYFVRSNQDEVQ